MSNIYKIYDDLSAEDYLCHKLKPRGQLLCGYCDSVYEPCTHETTDFAGAVHMITVCKNCGEVSHAYEEE